MAVSIGTEQPVGGTDPGLPGVVLTPRRVRALRLPRSGKIQAGLGLLAFFVLVAIIGPLIAPYSPDQTFANAPVPLPPSGAHLLGTTQLQQDVLSQFLVGGRSMMLVAFISGALATVLSVLIGVTAGYLGGLVDDLLSMFTNIFLVLPALPLLIIMFGFLGRSSSNDVFIIGLIIAATGWAFGARVLRAQTLSLRNRDYVISAKIIGERTWRVIGFEILPNLLPIVASSFLFTVLYGVGTYTAMAFLGLISPTHWSWGGMLFEAQQQQAEVSGWWWWYIPPGLAVAFLGTALALLNFGIDEFINPRLRAAGLTRRRDRRAGAQSAPRHSSLGLTPVIRVARAAPAGDAGRAGEGAQR